MTFRPRNVLAAALVASARLAHAEPATPPRQAAQQAPPAPPSVSAVLRVAITVSDLDAATDFYTRVLMFHKESEQELTGHSLERLTGVFGARLRAATLRLGDEEIELDQYLAPEGRPLPPDSRSNDRWFQHIAIVVSDMDRAYASLRTHKVRHASTGPQTLPESIPNAAGISAFYFKDPDGHALEIIHFPPDKGDPRWHRPTDRLFLGVDHTAIVVADTESSLRFYTGTLGLRIAGTSENFGSEQEHLNNVFGARLRITALRATTGPGIELLEYLAPRAGRPFPADSHANDLWQWHTTLVAPSITVLANLVSATRTTWISPGLVADAPSGPALRLRDPDGHAIEIRSPSDPVRDATPPAAAASKQARNERDTTIQ